MRESYFKTIIQRKFYQTRVLNVFFTSEYITHLHFFLRARNSDDSSTWSIIMVLCLFLTSR